VREEEMIVIQITHVVIQIVGTYFTIGLIVGGAVWLDYMKHKRKNNFSGQFTREDFSEVVVCWPHVILALTPW
jgi:hypothetical protein